MRRLKGTFVAATGVAALAFMAACPAGRGAVDKEVGPPLPTGFAPGPELGPEPPAPEGLPGRVWLDAVHERFHGAWSLGFLEQCRVFLPPSHALNDAGLAAILELTVSAEGELVALTVKTSSGNADFDAAAQAVARDSAPYPAPPADLRSDDGNYYVTWIFARDARAAAVAGARFDRRQWEASRAVPHLLGAGRWADAAQRLLEAVTAKPDETTLVDLGRQVATTYVEAALAGDESGLRVAAARAAGRARLTALAPSLRALAQDGKDPALRTAALIALGELGDAESVTLLLAVLGELDGVRSAAAAGALAALGARDKGWEVLAPHVGDGAAAAELRAAALSATVILAAPVSAPALAAILGDKGAPRGERVLAASALGAIAAIDSAEAVKPLAAALADGDAAVRAEALRAFARAGAGGYRSRGAFYKAVPLFKDRDAKVRAAAVLAAAAVEPKAATSEIAAIVRKDKNREVLVACATALGVVSGAEATTVLLKLSNHPEAAVQRAAQLALAVRAEDAAQAATRALSSSEDPTLRLLALGRGGEAEWEFALGDAALEVRAAALTRLIKTGAGRRLGRWLDLILGTEATGERLAYAEALLVGTLP